MIEDNDEFSIYNIYSVINYIKNNLVQSILLVLVFIIVYVVDYITNFNAKLYGVTSSVPGLGAPLYVQNINFKTNRKYKKK